MFVRNTIYFSRVIVAPSWNSTLEITSKDENGNETVLHRHTSYRNKCWKGTGDKDGQSICGYILYISIRNTNAMRNITITTQQKDDCYMILCEVQIYAGNISMYIYEGDTPLPHCVLRTGLFWPCVLRTAIFWPRVLRTV